MTQQHGADYSDLDTFGEYVPEMPFRPDLSTLADGDYDFTITDARLDFAQNGQRILKVGLRAHTGMGVEHTYWLGNQNGVNRLGADLLILGFPANNWGPGKIPLSKAIPEAVGKLAGIRFRATKKTRTKDGKHYTDLFLSGRLNGTSSPPPAPRPAPAPTPAGNGAGTSGSEIPF